MIITYYVYIYIYYSIIFNIPLSLDCKRIEDFWDTVLYETDNTLTNTGDCIL